MSIGNMRFKPTIRYIYNIYGFPNSFTEIYISISYPQVKGEVGQARLKAAALTMDFAC